MGSANSSAADRKSSIGRAIFRWVFLLVVLSLLAIGGFVAYFASEEVDRTSTLAVASEVFETEQGEIQAVVRGEGEPVLIIHGAPGGYDQGLLLAEVLGLDEGQTVVAYSRPGFLLTPPTSRPGVFWQGEDALALLQELGLPRVTVVGFSSGCVPAWWLAVNHPEVVSHLVLLSPVIPASSPSNIAKSPAALAKRDLSGLLRGPMIEAMRALEPNLLARSVVRSVDADPKSATAGIAANPAQLEGFVSFFDTLTPFPPRRPGTEATLELPVSLPQQAPEVPTLVIQGASDPFLQELPATLLGGASVSQVSVAKGGHWPWFAPSWREVILQLQGFLNEESASD